MKKILFLLCFLLSVLGISQSKAQYPVLSDSSIVSLITCDPGQELYTKFGHTGIRIQDSVNQIDWMFNYGVFDFNQPLFYWKFIQGKTDYLLAAYPTDLFLKEYIERKSEVIEQVLNLNIDQKRKLFNNLMINNEPQNRLYRYNFVFDNCATRPKNQIMMAADNKIYFENPSDGQTFRQLISRHLRQNEWSNFGINLVFGRDADRIANTFESDFLPINLSAQFNKSYFVDDNGNRSGDVVSRVNVLVSGETLSEKEKSWITLPFILGLIYFLTGIYFTLLKNKKSFSSKLFDSSWMILTGLAGVLVFFLSHFSTHPLVGHNLNILWLNPLNLIAVFLLWNHKYRKLMFFYYLLNVLMILYFIWGVALGWQVIPLEVIPLAGLALLRFTRRTIRNGKRLIVKTQKGYQWVKH